MILSTGSRKIFRLNIARSGRRAFTLLELMLVTIILAIASAVVVPNFALRGRRMELASSAEQLVYTIRFGQLHAISKGRPVRLVAHNNSYWLEADARKGLDELNELMKKPDYQPVKERWGRRVVLPRNIQLTELREPIEIFPNGTISAADLKVCRDQDCLLVSTTQQLGRVKVIAPKEPEDHAHL